MSVFFYRVESSMGEGPYASGHAKWLDEWNHPEPAKDGNLGGIHSYEVTGFLSLKSLEQWFTPHHRQTLLEQDSNYVVAVYKIDKGSVREGHYQAVADSAFLELVEMFNLADVDEQGYIENYINQLASV